MFSRISLRHLSVAPHCLSLCLLAMASLPVLARAEEAPIVPGEVLVGVRPGQDDIQTTARLATLGRSTGYQPQLHAYRIHLNNGVSLSLALAHYRQRKDVLYAEPNHLIHVAATPNDTGYKNQWAPARIQADVAWPLWQPTGQVVVAIVDTGVDNTHPDLTNKILRDASGIVGYDAMTGIRSDALDGHGHGTHCAGVAAAQINNGVGIAGIAGWNGLSAS